MIRSSLFSIPLLTATIGLVLGTTADAQTVLTKRTGSLPSDDTYPYVPVSLNDVANDTQEHSFPGERVMALQSIPFDLARKDRANCLFMKPLAWSVAKDETGEYPGGNARYDDWHLAIKDPLRALVRVPVGDYKAIWLLAATDNDSSLSDRVTLRLGVIEGAGPVAWHSVSAQVPRVSKPAAVTGVSATIPSTVGNLYLVRVPFAKAIAQDFPQRRTLWLEFTKDLHTAVPVPDAYRFHVRPLGVPSGVRIYGVTLERSPLQVEWSASEPGNVFNEPQVPTFRLKAANMVGEHYIPYTIETVATADDGTIVKQVLTEAFRTGSWTYRAPTVHQTVSVPVPKRGQYHLKLTLLARGNDVVSIRETTFALLASDTRKHRADSPFGTWDFAGAHVTPTDTELRGALYVKAGLRYGMNEARESVRRKYGLLSGADEPHMTNAAAALKAIQERMKDDPDQPPPTRFLVFHEHSVSGAHVTRTPDLFTGKKYKLNAEEEKQFKNLWDQAANNVSAIRAAYPKAEIYFGNAVPLLLEEFLRHGWPARDLGTIGNESACTMRLPEAQPPDFVNAHSAMWMQRQIANHYGAKDVPLRQCHEICYPGSAPGYLSEMTQASYLVRHCLHALAWKVPVIRPMMLTDVGNSYFHSYCGCAGLCHPWPNVSPKPAYVAYSVLTQALDGPTFSRFIPLDSTSVYAMEFKKRDGSFVTVLWTLRGARPMKLQVSGAARVKVTNLMGRESDVSVMDNEVTVEATNRPCYVSTPQAIGAIKLGDAAHESKPGEKSFVISSLDKLEEWTIQNRRDPELEAYNIMNPRRQGDFEYRTVQDDRRLEEKQSNRNVLAVKPKLPVPGSPYLQMYSGLAINKPVEIPGEPTQIGVVVKGNGGWGRIIFELEDANGQRWISIGAEQTGAPMPWLAHWLTKEEFSRLNPKSANVCDWNSDDGWGRSSINFDGWRLIRFPLPGQYPGDNYHWPMNSQWRWNGDGVVHYPLKFKRLVVTVPEKVLYGTRYAPPQSYEIRLKNLTAMYEPTEKAFDRE